MIVNVASLDRFPAQRRFEMSNLETEGYSDETARCFEVRGLCFDVACSGKLWSRRPRAMMPGKRIVCFV